jgi:hypothetical protein
MGKDIRSTNFLKELRVQGKNTPISYHYLWGYFYSPTHKGEIKVSLLILKL